MRQHLCPFDKIEKNIFVALKSSMTAYGSSHKNFSAFIGKVEKQSVEIKLAVRSKISIYERYTADLLEVLGCL